MLLLLFTALAAIAPKFTPAALASLGLVIIPQAVMYTYLPVVHTAPRTPVVQGTVFTSQALLDEAEARATRYSLNTLARRQLLAKADQILSDGGNEGNTRFGWESGPLYLAYAYHITGQRKYADLAAQVLKERTLAEQPALQNREDYSLAAANEVLMRSQRTTARAQTYALLGGYASAEWTNADQDHLREWLRTFGQDLKDGFAPGTCITNAKWFHLEGIAAAGAAVGDRTLLDFAYKSYRRYLDNAQCGGVRVINSQGFFDHEMRRFAEAGDDTWYYSGYSMLAMVRLAEIARNQGVNLYDYTTPDGRNLRKALDAHVPYLLGEKDWPHEGGDVSFPIPHREFMQAYEIAYVHWPDPDYLKVLQKFGDKRRAGELTDCLGPAAYLFANSDVAGDLPPNLLPTSVNNEQVIFDDGLVGGWREESWDTEVDLAQGRMAYDGKQAIAVTHTSRWAGFRLRSNQALSTTDFAGVRFWLNGGEEGGQTLKLFVKSNGMDYPQVALPTPQANAWILVEIALGDLGSPEQISDLVIQEDEGVLGRTFYVDQFSLIGTGASAVDAPKVLYETWSSVQTKPNADLGDLKRDARYPDRPSTTEGLESLDAPFHDADDKTASNFGSRLRTLIIAPVSGEYEFFLSADDTAELLLSTDSSPQQARQIAAVGRWLYRYDYTCERSEAESCARSTPRSGPITLVAGQAYYLEVNHLESVGEDHVTVAWRVPGSDAPALIAGDALAPLGSR